MDRQYYQMVSRPSAKKIWAVIAALCPLSDIEKPEMDSLALPERRKCQTRTEERPPSSVKVMMTY